MHQQPPTVVLAVDEATRELTDDDQHLRSAFEQRGVRCEPVVWGRPVSAGSTVVIRSTWDYVDRSTEFLDWLDRLAAERVPVHNPVALLKWNAHKGYLLDLAAAGHPVVPTRLLRRGTSTTLDSLRNELGTDRLVAKPAVGASARGALETGTAGESTFRRHLTSWLSTEDMIVQPFVDSVATDGELSVVALGGEISHTVRKAPAADEWRVQTEFGGSVELSDAGAPTAEVCRRLRDEFGGTMSYARVDLVTIDGAPHLMELELIEPDLFFGHAPGSADRLVDVVLGRAENPPGRLQ